jgi:hypothetical protein
MIRAKKTKDKLLKIMPPKYKSIKLGASKITKNVSIYPSARILLR